MFRRFSVNFAVFSVFLDMILVAASLFAAVWLRIPLSSLPFVQPITEPINLPWILFVIFPLLWVSVLLLFSVYDGRRNLRVVDELASLTLGSILASVAIAGVLYLSYREVSRFLFLFFAGLAFLSLLTWRVVIRYVLNWNNGHGIQQRRVLILGAGTVGKRLEAQIVSQPHFGLKLVGFLDDSPEKRSAHPEILGSLSIARQVIQQAQVDDVVLALPRSAEVRLNQIVSELHDLPVRVWVIPDYFALTLHRASVEEFAGIPMLDLRAPALSEYQRMVKRAFDLVLTLATMPVVLPAIGVIALAVYLDDGTPVFYRPKRVGENGRLFEMCKFRTMVKDAENLRYLVEKVDENGRLLHKSPHDPRVTRVGRFLRRTSLDELPQLFNVLRGEMSLVGPRPEMPYLVEKYDPWQRKRFAVPQGMTGWWQINGRSEKPMHLHTEEDLYYVQHYSLWLDLQILVKTAWVVLRGRGAY